MSNLDPLSPSELQQSPVSFVTKSGLPFSGLRGTQKAPAPALTDVPYVEKPWHRHAAYYFSVGKTIRDIGILCDVTENVVRDLVRRTQFQAEVHRLMEKGEGNWDALFRAELINSVHTLVEIRDDPEAPRSVRLTAAKEIVERVLGKTKNVTEYIHKHSENLDPVAEAEALKEEIRQMKSRGAVSEATDQGSATLSPPTISL